jgi:hypothetical protein
MRVHMLVDVDNGSHSEFIVVLWSDTMGRRVANLQCMCADCEVIECL